MKNKRGNENEKWEKKGWRIKKGWKGKMREDEEWKYRWEEEYGKCKRKLEKWKLMWNGKMKMVKNEKWRKKRYILDSRWEIKPCLAGN